jgi:apolipoprotein N-acyltransferase
VHSPTGGRVVQALGVLLVVAGILAVAAALVVRPAARQETAGIGLAAVMTGLMVLLLGNYLRHAARRAEVGRRSAQPNSVPTTDTNDTISPG